MIDILPYGSGCGSTTVKLVVMDDNGLIIYKNYSVIMPKPTKNIQLICLLTL